MMFVGAYWSARRESREEVADRLARFLSAIAKQQQVLSTWFLKGRTKASSQAIVTLNTSTLSSKLKVNRRDVGGDLMPELGFSLGIWNGEAASLAVTMGAYDTHIRNSVVLSFMATPSNFVRNDWRMLLDAAVRNFDPDYGAVTSLEYLKRAGAANPWDMGCFTYRRGGAIREHDYRIEG